MAGLAVFSEIPMPENLKDIVNRITCYYVQ